MFDPRKKLLTKFVLPKKLMFINRKKLTSSFQMKQNSKFLINKRNVECSREITFPTKTNFLISNKYPRWKQRKKHLLQEDKSPYISSHITSKQI